LRILHISHQGLPDMRVERCAYTDVKNGHECYFAGLLIRKNLKETPFASSFYIPWRRLAKLRFPYFWDKLKGKVKEVFREVKPDIVHAHDVFAAKVCHELSFPMIFNSHEYWAKETAVKVVKRGLSPLWLKHYVAQKYGLRLWSRWQNEIVGDGVPTLSVSPTIVSKLTEIGKHVFLLPNFPSRNEVEKIVFHEKNKNLSFVYVGGEVTTKSQHRNITWILDSFRTIPCELTIIGDEKFKGFANIKSLGFLNHDLMLNELTKHHIGLIPWKPHPYHYYCLPNKAAEYAHAGLLLMVTSKLVNVKMFFNDYCYVMPDTEIKKFLKSFLQMKDQLDVKERRLIQFARENIIWERYEKNIERAYRQA